MSQRDRVIDFIAEHQPITAERICQMTGLKWNSVTPLLQKLEKERVIARQGDTLSDSGRRAALWVLHGTYVPPTQRRMSLTFGLDVICSRCAGRGCTACDGMGITKWKKENA